MTRTERDRDRLRVEREQREAERVLAHLRGITLDEAAQALKDHAVLAGTSVIQVARELLAHRPVIRPRVLAPVTDLESWAATGRGSPAPSAQESPIPTQRTNREAAEQPTTVRNLDAV
jgi:hypothetical protein